MLLLPVYARDILHAGPQAYGLLVSAFGAGSLLAALRLTQRSGRWGLRRNLLLGLAACGVGLAVFAWSRSLPLSLAAGALAGFGLILYVASTNTLLQLTTEDRFRGRVMSLYTLMFVGTAPIGALVAGAIAQRWGAPVATTRQRGVMLLGRRAGGLALRACWRGAGRPRRRAGAHRAAGVAAARAGARGSGAGGAARRAQPPQRRAAVPEQPAQRPRARAARAAGAGAARPTGTRGRGARARARRAPHSAGSRQNRR